MERELAYMGLCMANGVDKIIFSYGHFKEYNGLDFKIGFGTLSLKG